MFQAIRKIHFVGIGGIGMSGIAEVLLNSGYTVSGSDARENLATLRLKKLGAAVSIGHAAENAEGKDVLVVSSAVSKNNPEIGHALAQRIPVIHRSEMLAEIMRLKYGIIVSGTHGKTTTTSLLAAALAAAGLDPTVVIGGKVNALDSSAQLGKGDLFVAEGDESDGSFLRLTPTIAVVTNIDKDHLDQYESLDAIIAAFKSFLDKVPFYGAVCACIDDPVVQWILPNLRRKLITYGFRPDADVTAKDVSLAGFTSTFTPVVSGIPLPPVTLRMPGRYNVLNALASFAVGKALDLDLVQLSSGISGFAGVEHRFTKVGSAGAVTVIDDYAHNPRKISTVLRGTREAFPNAHVIAIFQPHRYSRLKSLEREFAESFQDAHCVIVTPIYAAGEQPVKGVTAEHIARQIREASALGLAGQTLVADSLEDAADKAVATARAQAGEVFVLTLGAGDVSGVGPKVLARLGGKPDRV